MIYMVCKSQTPSATTSAPTTNEESSVRDVNGKQMRRLRRWIREGRSLLFILPVEAGLPLPVLPQMLFPGGDDENFDKALRDLAIAIQPPLRRPGAQPR